MSAAKTKGSKTAGIVAAAALAGVATGTVVVPDDPQGGWHLLDGPLSRTCIQFVDTTPPKLRVESDATVVTAGGEPVRVERTKYKTAEAAGCPAEVLAAIGEEARPPTTRLCLYRRSDGPRLEAAGRLVDPPDPLPTCWGEIETTAHSRIVAAYAAAQEPSNP